MVLIDINTLFNDLKSNINVKQGGQLRVRDFNSWYNQISIDLFKEKFSEWEKNQIISDDLSRPFLKSEMLITQKTKVNHALLPFPKDYAYFSSARVYINPNNEIVKCPKPDTDDKKSMLSDLCEVQVTKVDNSRWASVCTHKIIGPTIDRPFITQYEAGFKVAPKEVGFITLDYLRYPIQSKLVLTANQVYDPVATIPSEWSDTVRNEFLARLEIAYYKFIKEPFGYQTAQIKKADTP